MRGVGGICLAASLAALLLAPVSGRANGWEHFAVPLAALLAGLESEDTNVRIQAARSLGVRRSKAGVAPLIGLLAKPEENPWVRSTAYESLGRTGDRRALPPLLACLEEEQRVELRADCAAALGALADPGTLPRLLALVHGKDSLMVRARAVDALAGFPQPPSIEALAALAVKGRNYTLRLRAIRSLGLGGSEAALQPLLAALAGKRDEGETGAIVDALGRIGAPASRQPLTRLLEETENPELRTRIVVALGAVRDGSAFATLVRMLSDAVPAVRFFALAALLGEPRPQAAPPVIEMYRRLAKGLSDYAPGELALSAAAVAELSLQVQALRVLIEADAPAALSAFLDAAQPLAVPRTSANGLKVAEAVYERRRLALVGLGYTRARRAAVFLMEEGPLTEPDHRLRAAAVRSLGVLGFADAVDAVLPALEDPAAEVRRTAAMVLGRLGDRRAVAPLRRRLDDAHGGVRRQAALSLGFLDQ